MRRILVICSGLILLSLTQASIHSYFPNDVAQRIYQQASKAAWFDEGDSKQVAHVTYVLAEPNCYYCKHLYAKLRPFVQHKQLAVRWIVTAVLQPTSMTKAAALLQAPVSSRALERVYGQHQALSAVAISPATQKKLQQNNQLLARFHLGMPAMIYKTADKYQVLLGVPDDDELQTAIASMEPAFS